MRERANPEKSQVDHYRELIEERGIDGCTPEEMAGEYATFCDDCQRITVHQYAKICMKCKRDYRR